MDAFVAFVSRRPFRRTAIGLVVALVGVCLPAVRLHRPPGAVSVPVAPRTDAIAARPPVREAPSMAWKLAFELGKDIRIANGDGTDERLLVRNAAQPCWSPDRKRIAFVRAANVWIADADGGNQKQLTSYPGRKAIAYGEATYSSPISGLTWEPHSNRISFARGESFTVRKEGSNSDEDSSIAGSSFYSIATDGSDRGKPNGLINSVGSLFPNLSSHTALAWSPSGKYLAFVSDGDIWIATRGEDMVVNDVDETGRHPNNRSWDKHRLAATARYDQPNYRASTENVGVTRLSWSPDETMLAYGCRRLGGSGTAEVHILHLSSNGDDYGPQVASDERVDDSGFDPAFSPDGSRLVYWVFAKDTDNNIRVYSLKNRSKYGLIKNASGMPAW